MIGLRRMSHDEETDVLRIARGARLAQAEEVAYKRDITAAETVLGLR